ncbi:MAG: hypothetical protein LBR35_00765, partial [Rickettsiales bacterium]|nr:hypothetical protein [Rickettsiales bacterium]
EAIEFSLLSSGTEEIQTLYSSLHLQILTYSGEWVVNADHITPSSVAITKQTGIGSPTDIYLPVTQIETATIFISKDKKEVREFVYGEVLGNYTSNNLSQLSPHLIRDPIDIEYNKTINQLYIALSNGQLAVLTVIPQNQVLSWSVYETLGKFLSCKTIDKEIYFLIERNEKYFLEKFEEGLWTDCCISKTFDNDEERIIQNPNIYFDKEIYIKTDDYVFSKKPFEGQNIALPIKTKTVSFGYPYKHTLTPFTLTKMQGDSYKKYRLIQLSIKLLDTPVLELDTGFGLDVIYLCPMNYGQGLKDFTGDYFINTLGYKSYANDALWKIQSDFPFDFNMQSISLKIKAI